jgi:hypothetical protein
MIMNQLQKRRNTYSESGCRIMQSGGLRNMGRIKGGLGYGSLSGDLRNTGCIEGGLGYDGSLSQCNCSASWYDHSKGQWKYQFCSPLGGSSGDWIHNPTVDTSDILFAPLDVRGSAAREAGYLPRKERNKFHLIRIMEHVLVPPS